MRRHMGNTPESAVSASRWGGIRRTINAVTGPYGWQVAAKSPGPACEGQLYLEVSQKVSTSCRVGAGGERHHGPASNSCRQPAGSGARCSSQGYEAAGGGHRDKETRGDAVPDLVR